MDTTKNLPKGVINLNDMTLDTKRYMYSAYFSSNTNTSQSFSTKIELLTLLGYLTQQLTKRFPEIFKNSRDVLLEYVYKGEEFPECGTFNYIEGLSIVCDDLIWGVNDISTPSGYSNSVEIKNKIRELIAEWLPF